MAVDPRKVLPTKINLIRLRREARSIRRIRKVLEEKRSALILYVRSMIEEYERLYESVAEEVDKAYKAYGRAAIQAGYERVREMSALTPPTLKLRVRERVAFAVKVPVVDVQKETFPPVPGVVDVPPSMIEAVQALREAFTKYSKLVELEYSLRRLLEELKKTQRLINAIDNVVMPSLVKAIKHISLVLEERSREEFMRLKMMKRKRQTV
uniref:A-type ATP synthase subunit D n=1 Tax=Fervidicoccus fontis TaxID=683846 RepID=A0A7J3ZJ43_9CREN